MTVLDVSQVATEVTKKRLGGALADRVHWLIADIGEVDLPLAPCMARPRSLFISLLSRSSVVHTFGELPVRLNLVAT